MGGGGEGFGREGGLKPFSAYLRCELNVKAIAFHANFIGVESAIAIYK